ncbi:MAG: hypothetical protein MPW14_00565 [Candidatus Manganitrophus sp.]|nr:MAG: hypothetical protein MPW14_00565 [Candidatus Manganitrophus sp.]
MELTEPLEAAVVAAAHRAELAMPKRASLPSMLPPGCSALAAWSTPSAGRHRVARLLRPISSGDEQDQDNRHRRQHRPALAACRRPSGRRCSTAPPGSGGSPASAGSWTAASGSRTGAPSWR